MRPTPKAMSSAFVRPLILFVAVLACATLDVSTALAQSQNCSQLGQTLQSFERTKEFRNLEDTDQQARDAADQVQAAESSYVRGGCNAAAKAGQTLSRDCKALAKTILAGRKQRDALASRVETGNAIAQQREAVLQQMARFNCQAGSSATFTQQDRPDRRNLFEQLFDAFGGSDGGDPNAQFQGGEFQGYGGYQTVRTVCVRKSDGYFWPISYSTLVDYAANDATQCQEQCPGMDVDLYYYDNPGQEPEQMINLNGEAYMSLPNAFRYRTEVDKTATCKAAVNYGAITLMPLPDGQMRAMITYGSISFPLPIRDPRRSATTTIVAAADTTNFVTDIPLPRPRPLGPGETAPATVTTASVAPPERIVMFGQKRVRIVGPETPYAQPGAAGT